MGKFSNEITAYALRNAIEFGKADVAKILPKLFQHGLERGEIKEIMPEIMKSVKEINRLNEKEKSEMFDKFKQFVKEKEEENRDLPELPNAINGKVLLRLAPFPSGALHIGNGRTYILNALYTEKYNGKLILVMDDTIGSAEKQIADEAYQLIEDAFAWLGIKYEKVVYKSDRLDIYYKYAEELIEKDKAYVCHCSQEKLRKNREEGRACSCRIFPKNIQLARWKEMFGMAEGQATLRIKTDILHPNPAFRDRVLFKISDRTHPRVGNKYRVWPTLEMSWAIDDHLLGITHIIRGNDLMIESDMERYIWDILGWSHPEISHVGMVKFEGLKLSKSKSQKEVASGAFIGWHDPRTWSIQSFGFRGIRAEAIMEFIKETGVTRQDVTIPIDNLYSINRKMIDAECDRYSFIINPVSVALENKPELSKVDIPIHPDKKETREVALNEIFISRDDFEKFKDKEVRLLHLYNVSLSRKKVLSIENKDILRINWVSDHVKAKILMPDGVWIEGFAEIAVKDLQFGEVIQFERFGFARFDKISKSGEEDVFEFWFAHR